MKQINGNIFEELKAPHCVMIHVCNDAGGYGGGPTAIATQVKEKYPNAYTAYASFHSLGHVSCDGDSMKVFNLVAQEGYGARGKRYLNYGALSACLHDMISTYLDHMLEEGISTILVPNKMGADRAGGDFDIIMEMIDFILGDDFDIVVVHYTP